ncbi:hypothetical protein [Streptomyces sp. NPDC018031]|uniref:hypothetical protein n=1 Tax=Streptomyces sp. NPDC018031 TaxID=3365033 RepID=UPI0037BCB7F2
MSTPTLDHSSRTRTRPDRSARHPLVAEVRGGPARWIALVVSAADAVHMVASADSWQGSWPETQQELHMFAVLVLGPFAAAAGCWLGAREQRSHMAVLRACAARSAFAQFLVVAVPVALAVVAAHAVVTAGSMLASWPYTSGGRPLLAPPAADLVFLAAAAFVGVVVGRFAPGRLVPPVLAAGLYLLLGYATFDESPARFLSPAADDGFVRAEPVWWQPPAMMVWTGGLAAAAVLATTLRSRWSWSAVVPLALAASAAVSIARAGEEMWHEPAWARARACDDSVPKVCVPGERRDMLPHVSAAMAGVIGRLEGVRHLPDRFPVPQLLLGQEVVRGELTEPQRLAWETTSALVPECVAEHDDPVHGVVRDWLVSNDLSESRRKAMEETAREWGDRGIDAMRAESRALSRLTAMDDDRRRAWLSRYFKAVGSCDTQAVPVL